jgi:raffinose/stachyose/melibiose transport system permease protein
MESRSLIFKKRSIYIGILPAILLYLVLGVGPSLASFVFSFTDMSGLQGAPWHFIGLDNYKEYFFHQNYRDYISVIERTLIYAVATTVIQNAIALFVAILLNNKFVKGRNLFRAIIFMPVVLGVMVTSLSWSLFFNSTDGPAAKFLSFFGTSCNFFGDQKYAFMLCVFCQIWMYMGWSMIIFLAGLQTIPQELYEAGSIDGTTGWSAFKNITFPLLWSSTTVNILMSIIGALGSFQIILLTTGGNFDTTTLAMTAYQQAFGIGKVAGVAGLREGYASAISMILFAIILVFVLFTQYIMKKKEEKI